MLGAGFIAGCGESDSGSQSTATSPAPNNTSSSPTEPDKPVNPKVQGEIATGLDVPWGIAFLESGAALVSMRESGDVVRITPDGDTQTVGTVPGVVGGRPQQGEGGLLGLAFPPDDEETLFAYLTTANDNRIVKMSYKDNKLGKPQDVLTGIDHNVHHNGGQIVFGSDGLLYAATGDAENGQNSQNKGSLNGKILRINQDGDPAKDNPFDSPVFSYGHRNIEGLAFDDDGRLWATEFGDQAADELNLIEKGKNYGWPHVEGKGGGSEYTDPKAVWEPTSTSSPAGLAIVRSTAFVGALRGQCLFGVPLDGEKAGKPKSYFAEKYGRIRAVAAAPDGVLWVTTSNTDGRADPKSDDDRILRVEL